MTYRMQILVDSQAKENLLWLAEDRNASISKIVRDLANEKVKATKKSKKKRNAAELILESAKKLEKLGLGGPPDLSTNDDYIYG